MSRICLRIRSPQTKHWLVCMLLAVGVLGPAFNQSVRSQSNANQLRLQNLLDELDLSRLSLALAEKFYAKETDPTRRLQIAEKMLAQYQIQMLNPAARSEISELIRKANSLVDDFTQLNSEQLQLAFGHARFLQLEQQIFAWWQSGARWEQTDKLIADCEQLKTELARQQRLNNENREGLIAVLPLATKNSPAELQKINDLESRLALIDFLAAWTNYFQSMMATEPDKQLLKTAQENFFASLHIESNRSIEQLDSRWLENSTAFSGRALLGLAMVYTALENKPGSQYCFTRLRQNHPTIEVSAWQLRAAAFARNWPLTIELATQDNTIPDSSDAKRLFYQSVTYAGIAAEQTKSNLDNRATELQRAGLIGLSREFDFESITAIIQARDFDFSQPTAENNWIKGMVQLKAADSDPTLFITAIETLRQAQQAAAQTLEPLDQARIQYLIAVAHFKNRDTKSALATLSPAITNSPDLLLRESAQWLQTRILLADNQKSAAQIARALAALNKLESNFPASRYTERIQFEKLVLESKLLPTREANAILNSVTPDSKFYSTAVFELATNEFKIWQGHFEHQADSELEQASFAKLETLSATLLYDKQISTQNKATLLFYLMDANIKRRQSHSKIEELLSRCDLMIANDSEPAKEIIERYKFYEFRTAQLTGNGNRLRNASQWILGNSLVKPHRVAVLGYQAGQAEQNGATLPEKIKIYDDLVRLLGSDPQTLRSSQNARVAADRLVQLQLESDQMSAAKQLNLKLLATYPNRQSYILNAARILLASNDQKEALQAYRKLASGSQVGTPVWLEAKYSIAKIQSAVDKKLARQIIDQTMALTSKLTPDWQNKFDELAKELN